MSYTFFYDESNNIRKLYLKGRSFNTDSHSNPSPCFVLAGVVREDNIAESDIKELIDSLKLPPTAKELKFKQVAKGGFLDNLKSDKLVIILEWLLESDYFIHYDNINMEYWSLVDIIDDCCEHVDKYGGLDYSRAGGKRPYLDYHKDALYELMKKDKANFLSLLSNYGYPKIEPKDAPAFNKGLNKLAKKYSRPEARARKIIDKRTSFSLLSLSKLFDMCRNIEEYSFVYDHDAGSLIDGFSIFYNQRVKLFGTSKHVLDNEFEIQKCFERYESFDKELADVNYQFVDSKSYLEVQVSDVLCGLFKNYFTFINNLKISDLDSVKSSLTRSQRHCLQLISNLISKSDEKNKEFLFYVMSMGEHEKHKRFMFGEYNKSNHADAA
ncbi:DUF3800 domain-containing protein [Pseudomonas sp. RL]|uniref:DUF3800 domain-containing protein n=1 Tax=Pseudomonas sp. RL TaxID=1452718 RepID=UPI0012DF2C63|nr:DUF3800 domain-containing protein [Pseudomonas sp. RL]